MGFRGWSDAVVWSSFVYLPVSWYAYAMYVYDLALLMALVTLGSCLYHLHGEKHFLLLDAFFAGLMFVIGSFAVIDAFQTEGFWWMGSMGFVCGPLCAYLFHKSDLPGTKWYDPLHTVWHFVTAGFCMSVVHYVGIFTDSKSSVELVTWRTFQGSLAVVSFACVLLRDILVRSFVSFIPEPLKSMTFSIIN